jgi:prolyl oligopeptidase
MGAVTLLCALFAKAQPVNSALNDPYLWLEDVQGSQALAWVRERNSVSTSLLQAHPLFADNKAKVLAILNNRDQILAR